jgi:hypothetical protein
MPTSRPGVAPAAAALPFLLACSPERAPDSARVADAPRVAILEPAEGDTVTQPFTVRLSASGVAIVPASGLRQDGEGHHHLLIDLDLPAMDAPIPTGPGYVHVGTGASERVLDSLPPGPHRIIALLGWGDHVPAASVATDTVRIVVR